MRASRAQGSEGNGRERSGYDAARDVRPCLRLRAGRDGGPLTAAPPWSILAAVDANRSDPSAISYAIDRARDQRGDLTILCVWRPTPLLAFGAVAGYHPEALREHHQQEAAEWFRDRLAQVPYDVSVKSMFVEGLLTRRLLAELHAKHHDELILGHRFGPRDLARLRRVAPRLKVVQF